MVARHDAFVDVRVGFIGRAEFCLEQLSLLSAISQGFGQYRLIYDYLFKYPLETKNFSVFKAKHKNISQETPNQFASPKTIINDDLKQNIPTERTNCK